jgi:hypothetical protein
MKPFLQDHSPKLPTTRDVLKIEAFQWLIETPADRANFSSVQQGGGIWEQIKVPHYGPPLGPAATLYRTEVDLAQ